MNADLQNTAHESEQELIHTFADLFDWEDRYRYIIELGRDLPPFSDEQRTEENKIHGCQSNVWIVFEPKQNGSGEKIDFTADSDSQIVKGLVSILRMLYAGRTLDDAASYEVEQAFSEMKLREHLSPGRADGLTRMVERIRCWAKNRQSQ